MIMDIRDHVPMTGEKDLDGATIVRLLVAEQIRKQKMSRYHQEPVREARDKADVILKKVGVVLLSFCGIWFGISMILWVIR